MVDFSTFPLTVVVFAPEAGAAGACLGAGAFVSAGVADSGVSFLGPGLPVEAGSAFSGGVLWASRTPPAEALVEAAVLVFAAAGLVFLEAAVTTGAALAARWTAFAFGALAGGASVAESKEAAVASGPAAGPSVSSAPRRRIEGKSRPARMGRIAKRFAGRILPTPVLTIGRKILVPMNTILRCGAWRGVTFSIPRSDAIRASSNPSREPRTWKESGPWPMDKQIRYLARMPFPAAQRCPPIRHKTVRHFILFFREMEGDFRNRFSKWVGTTAVVWKSNTPYRSMSTGPSRFRRIPSIFG
jgi:hypothetical protein